MQLTNVVLKMFDINTIPCSTPCQQLLLQRLPGQCRAVAQRRTEQQMQGTKKTNVGLQMFVKNTFFTIDGQTNIFANRRIQLQHMLPALVYAIVTSMPQSPTGVFIQSLRIYGKIQMNGKNSVLTNVGQKQQMQGKNTMNGKRHSILYKPNYLTKEHHNLQTKGNILACFKILSKSNS